MKIGALIVFLSVILSVHAGVNYYIYHRGIQWLELYPQYRQWFKWLMLLVVLAYPLGRFTERIWFSPVTNALHWIGAVWFAFMLYFVLALVAVDILRLINGFFHFMAEPGADGYARFKFTGGLVVVALVTTTVVAGAINAWHPKISKHNIAIAKSGNGKKSLHIVAVSDVHLGTIINKGKTKKLVNTINGLKPDIILFAGDVVDEDIQPVIKQNLGDYLKYLKAPLGIYGITGNHEYIGGGEAAVTYLEAHGLKMLRDTAILIDDSFYVVGREDRDRNRFAGQQRKTVAQLTESLNGSKPIIMLDHQPYNLEMVQQAGVDLQISGHTHHGQMWPFGFITSKIFELSRGYLQKGDSHFIVSTGFGTWGPPVRTGNRPEILDITLRFNP